MNTIDDQYKLLLRHLLGHGVTKQTRNGEVLSAFGTTIRHNMQDGFPLLTTKKMAWKSIVTELLWFLRGDTNIKYLVDNGCHIWDGDAWASYEKNAVVGDVVDSHYVPATDKWNLYNKEEFISKIKTDDRFAKKWGDLGPIYGKQWRDWTYLTREQKEDVDGIDEGICGVDMFDSYRYYRTIDQIANLISELKTNPDSRRLMVNTWNVGELDQMVLPPCHYGFQVYTRELSNEEIAFAANKRGINLKGMTISGKLLIDPKEVKEKNLPTRAISLMWNQRSVDTFLGLPFNIASYGLLLEIIAKEVNMVPDDLIGNLGDVHLYSNHIDQAKEQIGRELTLLERCCLHYPEWPLSAPPTDVTAEVLDRYGVPTTTREPFELPTLEIHSSGIDDIAHHEIADFEIKNYQSHPAIKAPLSN